MTLFFRNAKAEVNPSDVAAYILERVGPVSSMKLQKLLYYSQAWHLVWTEKELFAEDFEAWANGPVLRSIYNLHRGEYRVAPGFFKKADASKLTKDQKEMIDGVLEFYASKDPQWLSDLTHIEDPWRDARTEANAKDGERCDRRISKASMLEYYSSLK